MRAKISAACFDMLVVWMVRANVGEWQRRVGEES
jgi:hypothetical protein